MIYEIKIQPRRCHPFNKRPTNIAEFEGVF